MGLDLIPYHKKQVLIIEDLAEMRSSMKSMLANIGVQHTDAVSNGEEGIKKIRDNNYDIIFSDYELGRGKDGQQVLEEVRYSGLIRAQTIFILVTAAQTADMVMGALEYEPDGYITKPVTLDILRSRLNRIVRTKEIYREINKAIDRDDINGALEACNRLAVEHPKFALPAYRIKGNLLIKAKRYDEARDIFDTVLGIKRVAWAMLGMGKVQYYRGDYEDAQEILEGLSATKAKYVEAQDWLAKTLEVQGKYRAAQKVLQEAINTSPKSVTRQQAMGRLAEMNGDTDTMYKAYRRAVALGQNSCFATPDAMIGLAKALQPKIKHGSMRDKKMSSADAFRLCEHARMDFDLTAIDGMKCALAEAETLFNIGKEEEGQLSYRVAMHIAHTLPDLTLDQRLDLLNARFKFESPEDALAEAERIQTAIGNDKRLQIKHFKIMEQYYANDPEKRLALMKERAQSLIDRNDIEDALELLNRAVQLSNADDEVRVLLLKAYVTKFEKGRADPKQISAVDELCKKLATLPEQHDLFVTYERLQKKWLEITGSEE